MKNRLAKVAEARKTRRMQIPPAVRFGSQKATKIVSGGRSKMICRAPQFNNKRELESKVQIDDSNLRSKQVQQILKGVAIRLKSLGCAVVIQPRVVFGRYSTSLIIGDTRDATAHLHAAESIGVQIVGNLGDAALQQQFAEQLFRSTALLSEVIASESPILQ